MKTKYLLLASALCCIAAPAFAQDAPAQAADPTATPDQEAPAEDIVVTGSRIPRNTYDNPTPTTTLDNADIAESGDSELSETLADIPSLSSTTNEATVTGNVQNSGLSAIQLRNLGDNRTLVLIDGRRTVSNSGIGNRVSISTIPSDFVDRVEIITGGASSVYGSDAVAGVVNIITESRQRGFKVNARAGVTEDGDGQERTINGSFGTRFGGGRGYFLISGTYDQDDRHPRDRPRMGDPPGRVSIRLHQWPEPVRHRLSERRGADEWLPGRQHLPAQCGERSQLVHSRRRLFGLELVARPFLQERRARAARPRCADRHADHGGHHRQWQ